MMNMNEEELLCGSFQDITHPDDLESDMQHVQDLISGRADSYSMEKRYIRKDGSIIWANLRVSLVRDDDNNPLFFISQIQDITRRREIDDELQHMARYDVLTGLANRATFLKALQKALDRAARHHGYSFGVLFIDLDGFKSINDTLGHLGGDELLKAVGQRLLSCVRPTDFVSRIGGDEFTMLIQTDNESSNGSEARAVAGRVVRELSKPFTINGVQVTTGASIGIAISTSEPETPDSIIHRSDVAMYKAKSTGKNKYCVFDPTIKYEEPENTGTKP
jgi:diguanylate cyclase (GGDEF)-like protein